MGVNASVNSVKAFISQINLQTEEVRAATVRDAVSRAQKDEKKIFDIIKIITE